MAIEFLIDEVFKYYLIYFSIELIFLIMQAGLKYLQ